MKLNFAWLGVEFNGSYKGGSAGQRTIDSADCNK